MKPLRFTGRYKRDYKRIAKRGYSLDLIIAVINLLIHDQPLPPARRDHPLKGAWKGYRECHIEPNWLLIYKATDDEVLLAATGTHACSNPDPTQLPLPSSPLPQPREAPGRRARAARHVLQIAPCPSRYILCKARLLPT